MVIGRPHVELLIIAVSNNYDTTDGDHSSVARIKFEPHRNKTLALEVYIP